jgi:hypothetical protein
MPVPPATQNLALVVTADLIGAWSLESYTDTLEGAETLHPLGLNPLGLLIYTPDNFMSAQLMSLDPSHLGFGDSDANPKSDYQQKPDGFICYSGEYQFDEVTATVSHMPSVSFVSSLIGQRLKRQVDLEGARLTLTVVTSRVGGESVKTSLCWLKLHR